ncbi:hypothetical protein [Nitrosomonas communis]|uniref:Uncharacterized protein n=1 Tax=Nitrosomonas communis TaxID=44574 RepID=A0A1H2Z906_9PROT|nr:hypothetical protein [Nitrosomonas communis]SDX13890.1 hypothetical protein SAMN05421882_10692 [Nitrosomonas communis]
MARPLRIEFAGALYHVTASGNAREDIYHNDMIVNSFCYCYRTRLIIMTGIVMLII